MSLKIINTFLLSIKFVYNIKLKTLHIIILKFTWYNNNKQSVINQFAYYNNKIKYNNIVIGFINEIH